MNIPLNLENCLYYNSFTFRHPVRHIPQLCRDLDTNDVFHKALIASIGPGNNFFVPTAVQSGIYNRIDRLENAPTTVVRPLVDYGVIVKKSPSTILPYLLGNNDDMGFVKVVTEKGVDYIGGSGLILDAEWNPLMMTGFDCDWDTLLNNRLPGSPVLYVHPSVFTRKDCVSKYIVTKLIPWYSQRFVCVNAVDDGFVSSELLNRTIVVRVEDFSHMFISPADPSLVCGSDHSSLRVKL